MNAVAEFEKQIAEFYGAPYCVAVDSCTHGIELCLLLKKADYIKVPHRTYLSIPMLAETLGITRIWKDDLWQDYYEVYPKIYDAAVLWRRNSYIKGTYMAVSFQYQKHLSLGRGGAILLDNRDDAETLKKMSYDGRLPDIPWRDQDVEIVGRHFYMQIETAYAGLIKLPEAIERTPRQWNILDWPDLTLMKVFR